MLISASDKFLSFASSNIPTSSGRSANRLRGLTSRMREVPMRFAMSFIFNLLIRLNALKNDRRERSARGSSGRGGRDSIWHTMPWRGDRWARYGIKGDLLQKNSEGS